LDYYYELGWIDIDEYNEYSTAFDYFEESDDTESQEIEKNFLDSKIDIYKYYNLEFTDTGELEDFYKLGLISENEYREFIPILKYFDKRYSKNKIVFDNKINFFTEITDYEEKTDDLLTGIKIENTIKISENDILKKSKNLKNSEICNFGALVLNKNEIFRHFNEAEQNFYNYDFEKKNELEKIYFDFDMKKTRVIIGDFKARFGMGLTFAKTNSINDGFSGDLSMPYRRTFEYNNEKKKELIDNNYLHGIGFYQKIKNFEVFYIFSDSKNPLDDVSVINFQNQGKTQPINELDNEKINAVYLGYNFLNFFKAGGVYYKSENDFFSKLNSYKKSEGKGFFLELNSNNFFYQNEISFVSNRQAFINKFGFDNKKDFDFYISYRNYPKDYFNSFGNTLRLRPNQKYFWGMDETGLRWNLDYEYILKSNDKLRFEFLNDIYSYSKIREKISETKIYEIITNPNIINKNYFLKTKYYKKDLIFEFGYKFYDRNTEENSKSYYDRKDAYYDYGLTYNSDIFNVNVQYLKKTKAIDTARDKYYSEYLKFLTKFYLNKNKTTFFSSQINLTDTYIDKSTDDIITYSFLLSSKILKNLNIKIRWNLKSYKDKDESFIFINDELEDVDDLFLYNTDFLNRWKLEMEWKF
jgi:hypothetical protein